MNKKTKAKRQLEADIQQRQITTDDCPTCKMHFYSAISREAHQKMYPSHFKQENKTP